jgi:hypothetical protein
MYLYLNGPETKARTRVWSLAEFIENPAEPLEQLVDLLNPRAVAPGCRPAAAS